MNPDPADLTDLATVKAYKPTLSNKDDDTIQLSITGFSKWLLRMTGQASLNTIASYNEWYDGNDGDRLFLRNTPITAVSLVLVMGVTVPVSADHITPGYVISQSGKSIDLVGAARTPASFGAFGLYGTSYRLSTGFAFARGRQNVNVQYSAGYQGTPADLQEMVTRVVAQNLVRRNNIDMKSKGESVSGANVTTSYQGWEMPLECWHLLQMYKRTAPVR